VDTEGACRVCRSWRGIEAAHIIPRSLGGEQKPDSIVPLCRQCHQAYDEFDLDILPHLTKDEQAEAVRVLGITRALARLCPSHNQKRAA
jgi:5-methylcytosine-specific restriction endonuclease McrA